MIVKGMRRPVRTPAIPGWPRTLTTMMFTVEMFQPEIIIAMVTIQIGVAVPTRPANIIDRRRINDYRPGRHANGGRDYHRRGLTNSHSRQRREWDTDPEAQANPGL